VTKVTLSGVSGVDTLVCMPRFARPFALALALLLPMAAAAPRLLALERQPTADYHARRVALADKLKGGVAVFFANYPPDLEWQEWRQDEDFYYLTGWNEPGAVLVVEAPLPATAARAAQPYRETLFLPTRNLREELFTGVEPDETTPGVSTLVGVDQVAAGGTLVAELNRAISLSRSRPVWTEGGSQPAHDLLQTLAASFGYPAPRGTLGDVSPITQELRAHKDAGELALMHKAADASVAAQLAMIHAVHPGQKERTVEGVIYATLLDHGCERPSYPSIVGSGEHATELHYSADSDVMHAGDLLVVDAAGEYSMYASDITRTMPISGHYSARQREIYNIVLGAQAAAAAAFVAGQSRVNDPGHHYPDSLDTIAWKYMNEHGKDKHGEPLGKYFIHGIGHPVGIDVHDPTDYSKPITVGQVFTIEPGIYIPEERIGVRIEDVFYVAADGKLECLTCALPKRAEDIERLMGEKK
jgi:Xaa-Pro aminopeptidase